MMLQGQFQALAWCKLNGEGLPAAAGLMSLQEDGAIVDEKAVGDRPVTDMFPQQENRVAVQVKTGNTFRWGCGVHNQNPWFKTRRRS